MFGMKLTSWTDKDGPALPGGGEVNSLTRKKPKNAKVNEAQSITVSKSSESAGFNKLQNWLRMEMVFGSRFSAFYIWCTFEAFEYAVKLEYLGCFDGAIMFEIEVLNCC